MKREKGQIKYMSARDNTDNQRLNESLSCCTGIELMNGCVCVRVNLLLEGWKLHPEFPIAIIGVPSFQYKHSLL